ncbi:MAG TPA: ABC transporter ATP-binding protein [Armatimonadota bacterium]|nr:ABC transporter ATP-binding protein [Armatimonadota bacterium]
MIDIQQLIVHTGQFTLGPVNLSVPSGEYAVLMGPSGCGKTTLLEAMCGLRRITHGSIRLAGQEVSTLPPATRGIGYVPQDGALFPTMSVFEHLAFPLQLRKWKLDQIRQRVAVLSKQLQLSSLLDRYPNRLSGGERQRVALGRALSASPTILCLDEPLNAFDVDAHARLCTLLRTVHQQLRITVLHVTHNPQEAERLATCMFTFDACIQSTDSHITQS